jgi:hypothetical protein
MLLLESCVTVGTACRYLAPRVAIARCCWHLVLTSCLVAGIACYCCHHVIAVVCGCGYRLGLQNLTKNPDQVFVGKFDCQSRSDRGLLKWESVPNRVPDAVYRSRPDLRPEVCFRQSGTGRYRKISDQDRSVSRLVQTDCQLLFSTIFKYFLFMF